MKRFFVAVCAAAVLFAAPLSQHDREFGMSHLHASRKMLLDTLAPIKPSQWNFKPSPEQWSIGEIAEHLVLTEDTIFQLVSQKLVQMPADEAKLGETKGKDEKVLTLVPERTTKVKTSPTLEPTHRWKDKAAAVEAFKTSRDRTISYLDKTTDDLRGHSFRHPAMGELDGYQWLLLISAHTERHIAQMKEVMANPNYPKK